MNGRPLHGHILHPEPDELPPPAEHPTAEDIEAFAVLPLTQEVQECDACRHKTECWQRVQREGRFHLARCNEREPYRSMQTRIVAQLEAHGVMSTLELQAALEAKQHGVYSVLKRLRVQGQIIEHSRRRASNARGIEKLWQLLPQGG